MRAAAPPFFGRARNVTRFGAGTETPPRSFRGRAGKDRAYAADIAKGDAFMAVLLHICCAPCSVECIDALREEGMELHGYWYNPNIQPYTEYRARRDTLVEYAKRVELPLKLADEYDLRAWVRMLPSLDDRCGACYASRLERAAAYAAEHGFEAYSTTLLISPYQRHELIRETGERIGREHGVEFLYRDFRPRFREGQRRAREMGLYMQKYCGCVFSEEERYLLSKKKKREVSGTSAAR